MLFLTNVLVVQFFLDHHIDHCQQKGQIGSRFDGKPFIGQDGGFAVARINDDHFGALLLCLHDTLDLAQIDPSGGISPDDHDEPGIGKIVGGKFSHGEIPGGVPGGVAGGSMGEVMGAAHGVHEPQRICLVGLRIIDPEDRFGAVIQQDEVDLLRDLLIGLFPRDGLELSVHPLQRGTDPVGVVQVMKIPMTLGAECALIAVGLRVAFDLPDALVFHVGKEGAAIPAPVADGGNAGRPGPRRSSSPSSGN